MWVEKGQNKLFHWAAEVHHPHASIVPQEAAFELDQIQPLLKCFYKKKWWKDFMWCDTAALQIPASHHIHTAVISSMKAQAAAPTVQVHIGTSIPGGSFASRGEEIWSGHDKEQLCRNHHEPATTPPAIPSCSSGKGHLLRCGKTGGFEGLDVIPVSHAALQALQRHFHRIRNKRIRKRCE